MMAGSAWVLPYWVWVDSRHLALASVWHGYCCSGVGMVWVVSISLSRLSISLSCLTISLFPFFLFFLRLSLSPLGLLSFYFYFYFYFYNFYLFIYMGHGLLPLGSVPRTHQPKVEVSKTLIKRIVKYTSM